MSRSSDSYTARLDRTLQVLQARVREQEAALLKMRSSTAVDAQPSEDAQTHLVQLRTIKHAYDSVTQSEPGLPSAESPIPALLALRSSQKTIAETRESITQAKATYLNICQRLDKENKDHHDAKLIQSSLETRIASLQTEIDGQTQKSPLQLIKEMRRHLKNKQAKNDIQVAKLINSFNSFVDSRLALMLAAEELGGPIVGETMHLNEATLESGFNAQGKVKRVKTKPNDDQRQRYIDEIWGLRAAEDVDEPRNEGQAAGAAMRELTEKLLNSLVEAGGNGPGTYVNLQRESAAARFLVRSKVAQFHPRDAKKLRLIDFGGELSS